MSELASSRIPGLPSDCQHRTLGIAFFDLTRFAEWASTDDDEQVARFLQGFYELAVESLDPVGATIVKFMGDAGLAVFDPGHADNVIPALCEFSRVVREQAHGVGLDTHLGISVHVGPVLAGTFGAGRTKRFDVIGNAVNIAARLGRQGVTLSPQAFRCLGPETRQAFEEIKPPATYRFRD